MADIQQNLLGLMRAAIQRYDMIQPHDRIGVGVSGGKDSVALLTLLAGLRSFYPVPFTLTAITLDPQFDGRPGDYTALMQLCQQLQVPFVLRPTRLWEVVFEQRNESSPCSLCARMRRGALHRTAIEAGCNVVALGHHKDDAAETFLMNLLAGGTLGCFSPKSYLDRRQITLIRPLAFMEERDIAAFVQRHNLPIVKSRCPVDGCTNRQQTKELLASLKPAYGDLTEKILHAMQKNGLDGW